MQGMKWDGFRRHVTPADKGLLPESFVKCEELVAEKNEIIGFVRRIDFEPKRDFLGDRTYAHVFLIEEKAAGAEQVDVYTDDPRFEAAFLAIYEPSSPKPPKVEVHWEDVDKVKKVVRVIVDREFASPPGSKQAASGRRSGRGPSK